MKNLKLKINSLWIPVANRLTISEAGSTSEMSTGLSLGIISSWPRKEQARIPSKADSLNFSYAFLLLLAAAS